MAEESQAAGASMAAAAGELMPAGQWVRIELPGGQLSMAGVTCNHPQVGLTLVAWRLAGPDGSRIDLKACFRVGMPLPDGSSWRRLSEQEATALGAPGLDSGLPAMLAQAYGPLAPPGSLQVAWRERPQPQQLHSVRQEGSVPTLAPAPHLRRGGRVLSCERCWELFEAPAEYFPAVFPDVPPESRIQVCSAFCCLCGALQRVEPRPADSQ